jgi:hypothetical protein
MNELRLRAEAARVRMDGNDLVEEYARKIEPYIEKAKKAYGPRTTQSDAHEASREYTRLLVEYHQKGGRLSHLAKKINASYPGIRRRIMTNSVQVSSIKPKERIPSSQQDITGATVRVLSAKAAGPDAYHDQLRKEYEAGISLAKLAKNIGLSSAAPLYYGVQRSLQRQPN